MPTKTPKRMMSPSDTVAEVARIAGMPKAHVSAVLRGLKALLELEVPRGTSISLGKDFGRFTLHTTAKRNHFVPSLGKEVKAGGNMKIKFIPSLGSFRRFKAKKPPAKK